MRLILVRHGESEENLLNTASGQSNSPLTSKGRVQAARVAAHLALMHVDAIYSSSLERAYETALTIATYHALPVTRDARIGEADFGRGAQSKSGFFGVPALMELAQDAGIDPMTYDLHGGESIGRLAQRVALFLSELVEQHAGETVVIVCHGGVIRVALFTLLKLPTSSIATLKHVNTAYTILDLVEDGSWRAHVIAATDHLDEVS